MKRVICLVMIGWLAISPGMSQEEKMSPSELRQEQKFARQEAEAWVKEEMATRKKVIACLRKIKDERSAKKAAAQLCKILDTHAGEQTAMGEVGEASRPTGAAIENEDKKRQPAVDKQKNQIKAELERIEKLQITDTSWVEAQSLVEKLP